MHLPYQLLVLFICIKHNIPDHQLLNSENKDLLFKIVYTFISTSQEHHIFLNFSIAHTIFPRLWKIEKEK